ncbi:Nif3-like dinuclear metal center hexameric protein [Chryseobacterium sp. A301]
MQLHEVISKLETRIHPRSAEDFDNVGLLCGNLSREITGILVCHDALESVVGEAIEENKNLIVCFHPIVFSGLKKITGKDYVERSLLKAIENKIAIYAIHTSFDNDYFGVNYGICQALGLHDQKILMPKEGQLSQLQLYVPRDYTQEVKEALFKAGAGNTGFYDECSFVVQGEGTFRPKEGSSPFSGHLNERSHAKEDLISVIFESYKSSQITNAFKMVHPYEEVAYQIHKLENKNSYSGLGRYGELPAALSFEAFLELVKSVFNLEVIRHSNDTGKPIRRVGVLGGSGASGIQAAKSANCDAYLTGDLKYHDFFLSENQILLCDIGHFESEQFVTQQLFDILSEKFPKFAISKTKEKTNPVNYFL